MQHPPPSPETQEQKIARLEKKIDLLSSDIQKIKRKVLPPWWQAVLKFLSRNAFSILGFVIVGYFLWQMWELLQTMLELFEKVQSFPGAAKDEVLDQVQKLKFW